jgi:hypothetical protein
MTKIHLHPLSAGIRLTLLVIGAAYASPAAGLDDAPKRPSLTAFTGARTRLVWSQDADSTGSDPFARFGRLRLMGLDTERSDEPFVVAAEPANYHKPLITPSGDRIVVTDYLAHQIYTLNWDGTDRRDLASGMAADVWRDPSTGVDWVYLIVNETQWFNGGPVDRVQLEDPARRQRIWDRTPVLIDNFQLSADGERASGIFPHPYAGYAELPNGEWTFIARGCWTSMAPDNSYLMWVFDGPHRNLTLYAPRTEQRWRLPINRAPEIGGYEVYHPRWSNHPYFMVMTGPYVVGSGGNKIEEGGSKVEVYLGRFARNASAIEEWRRVTFNDRGDFYPDVWIEGGETAQFPRTAALYGASTPTPRTREELEDITAWRWDNANRASWQSRGGEAGILTPRGRAVFGRGYEMDFGGGAFLATLDSARMARRAAAAGAFSLEAVIQPEASDEGRSGPLITYCLHSGIPAFRVALENSMLLFSLPWSTTPGPFALGPCPPGQPRHLAFVYELDRLRFYLDGQLVLERPAPPTDYSALAGGRLEFGSDCAGQPAGWHGRMERVRIYDEALHADTIVGLAAAAARSLAERPPSNPRTIRARAVEVSAAPRLEDIAPYRRALVVHSYEVLDAGGDPDLPPRIAVAHWAILDGERVEPVVEPGNVVELKVEPFEDHPQLDSERQVMDIEEITLPLYVETSR